MESEKSKVEALFEDLERRLAETSKLTVADRRKELQQMDAAAVSLTREFERFQMIGFNKYPDEIDAMEDRLGRLKANMARMLNDDVTISAIDSEPKLHESDVVGEEYDPTKQLVDQTNAKLAEGKARAQNMLRLANNMRDELNMIDDEVMLQREKLITINGQIKHAQSVTNQTKKLVNYFTKAVNDDKIVKGLILIVAVMLVVIVGMATSIKFRKGKLKELKQQQEKVLEAQADYSKIDEGYFFRLSRGIVDPKKPDKQVKQTPQAGEEPLAEVKTETTEPAPEGEPKATGDESAKGPETTETPSADQTLPPEAPVDPPADAAVEQPPTEVPQGEGQGEMQIL